MLGRLGAEVADADRLAREALLRPAAARAVARAFGRGVLGRGGRVDRAAVAALVFRGTDRRPLRRLERILHPLVRRSLRAAVAGARRRRAPAVALDVPLLFESGLDRACDATLFVAAPAAVRAARARRRGWSAADLRARDARQGPAAERRRRADFTVDNGGGRAATWRQVRALWDRAVSGAGPGPADRRRR
jgi:dephospho-CoA kinase